MAKERNARVEVVADFQRARETREKRTAGHTTLTPQSNTLRERDKLHVGAGAALTAGAIRTQTHLRINGPADLVLKT